MGVRTPLPPSSLCQRSAAYIHGQPSSAHTPRKDCLGKLPNVRRPGHPASVHYVYAEVAQGYVHLVFSLNKAHVHTKMMLGAD